MNLFSCQYKMFFVLHRIYVLIEIQQKLFDMFYMLEISILVQVFIIGI